MIYRNIKKALEECSMGDDDLIKALGVRRGEYELWMSGREPIPARYVIKICVILGESADVLFVKYPPTVVKEKKLREYKFA